MTARTNVRWASDASRSDFVAWWAVVAFNRYGNAKRFLGLDTCCFSADHQVLCFLLERPCRFVSGHLSLAKHTHRTLPGVSTFLDIASNLVPNYRCHQSGLAS